MAILNGAKEAILDGDRHVYDSRPYMCCSLNLPVEAGAPKASPNDPLLGVYIALDPRVMTERTMEIESIGGIDAMSAEGAMVRGLSFAGWSPDFTEAMLRLIQLVGSPSDIAIFGKTRLREVYYAVSLRGAGNSSCSESGQHGFSGIGPRGNPNQILSHWSDIPVRLLQRAN